MTELQTSLIAIGGTIIVGVISYNKWQEYKARKNVERAFSSAPEDVLMKNEPQLSINDEPVTSASTDAMVPHAPDELQEDSIQEEIGPAVVNADTGKNSIIDPLVDLSIPLMLEGPLWGEKILPVIQSLRHVGNKAVHYAGRREDGGWEMVSHGTLYDALQAGVQLANRSSALNEIEYSELITHLRQIADSLNAELDVPNMTEVMNAARELHQFISEYDAQLSINIRANGAPWVIGTLLNALARQGFDLRPDGRLIMSDGDNGILFLLSTNATAAEETTSRLTLLLDVPRVAPMRDGFGAMAACAKSLAARLDGTIVDDADQPLSNDSMMEIAAQVRDFYEQMEISEIHAGSTRALRLFS